MRRLSLLAFSILAGTGCIVDNYTFPPVTITGTIFLQSRAPCEVALNGVSTCPNGWRVNLRVYDCSAFDGQGTVAEDATPRLDGYTQIPPSVRAGPYELPPLSREGGGGQVRILGFVAGTSEANATDDPHPLAPRGVSRCLDVAQFGDRLGKVDIALR